MSEETATQEAPQQEASAPALTAREIMREQAAQYGKKAEAKAQEEGPPGVAEGYARIDLPENHPLRSDERQYLDVLSTDEEVFKSTINAWPQQEALQRAEAARQEADQQMVQLRQQLAIAQAQASAHQSEELRALEDAKLQRMLKQAEVADPERGKMLREGIEAKRQLLMQQAAWAANQQAQNHHIANQFLNGLKERAPGHYRVWGNDGEFAIQQRMQPLLAAYGAVVDNRMKTGGPGPNLDEFFSNWVDPQYVQDPRVQQAINAAREKQESNVAQRHATRPPGFAVTAPGSSQQPPADSLAALKTGDRRRTLREIARNTGRTYAGA